MGVELTSRRRDGRFYKRHGNAERDGRFYSRNVGDRDGAEEQLQLIPAGGSSLLLLPPPSQLNLLLTTIITSTADGSEVRVRWRARSATARERPVT